MFVKRKRFKDSEEIYSRIVFDIAAQTDDEVVDGACVGILVHAPDLLQDVLARDNLAGMHGEVAKKIGFHKGEVRGAVRRDQFESVEVDLTVGKGVAVVRGFGRR